MAPSKKSKTVGKRVAAVHDVSPSKDVKLFKKSKKKKPKLVDMLGPQWSKQELERFYQGFRKYGNDWKKVATIVQNRSLEMIEALYNMNRAYLSLPEGTASVVGLIAMMTDHYNNLEGNGSEADDDYPGISQKSRKCMKGAFHVGLAQGQYLQSQPPKSTDSCLSLLKRCYDGWQLHVPVRKRTPRVPIPALERKFSGVNSISPVKSAQKSGVRMGGDEIAHRAALLLSETLHQVDSSQLSPTTNGTMEDYKREQVSMGKQMGKYFGIKMNDESIEGSFDSKRAKNVDLSVKLSLAEYKKEKKGKKQKDRKTFHDIPEAYSDLNRRLDVERSLGRLSFEPANLHQAQRKRSKITEDETLACDALHALADMSLALTASAAEPVESSRESANGGEVTVDSTAISDATLVNIRPNEGSKKKKQKTSKIQTAEKQCFSQSRRLTEEKALAEEDTKSKDMFTEHNQANADTKHCKSTRSSVVTSIIDQEMAEVDVAVSSRQHLGTDQVILPSKRQIQRKRERPLITNDTKEDLCSSRDFLRSKHSSLLPGTVPYIKDKLSCFLSSPLLRRWCGFEWFYSAIDYPWFSKKEFDEYLNHVGLGHVSRLTRVEWSVIKSSLGRPRRFSPHFLQEEREKLEQYRESVRTHYSELRAGHREGLPTDLARPLSVGQRVIAMHPKSREFHDGSILTVDHDKFRVQFDCPELGVELVEDINCMPCNQLENMPEVMRRQKFSIDYANSNGQFTNGQSMLPFSSQNTWSGTPTPTHAALYQAKVDLTSTNPLYKEGANKLLKTPSTMQVETNAFQLQPREGNSNHSVHQHNSLAGEVLPYLVRPKQERFSGNLANGSQSRADIAGAGEVQFYVGDCEDSASKVAEIWGGSREKAHRMVDAAIQAISCLKEGECPYERIGEALESMSKIQPPSESGLPLIPFKSRTNGRLNDQTEVKVSSSGNSLTNCSGDGTSDSKDLKFPSELITSCVTTLLMIQKCTDRQYPPEEVAHILDHAATSMQPCCPQNLTVYREIEMCMGRIKTQILALIPS